jgi:hypothetical protein
MGTTVTTNLGLIKPDIDEKIQEDLPTFEGWATQNQKNVDKLDALFRHTSHSYTLTWGALTTPPTLGATGFTEAKYIRLWPRMVIVYFRIYAGLAGFAAGAGSYTLNLPPDAIDPEFAEFSHTLPIGKMIFQDNNAVLTSTVMPLVYSPASGLIFARPSEGGTWSATLPVVPAGADRYSGYFMYPTQAA